MLIGAENIYICIYEAQSVKMALNLNELDIDLNSPSFHCHFLRNRSLSCFSAEL